MSTNKISSLSEKEKKTLDRKMEMLKPRMYKAKQQYDSLVFQYTELLELRHPEKKEERIKETLYAAYQKSYHSLEEILAYMAGEDNDDT